ncbi:hypothetical protein RJ640_023515 [Escallonia rubra]|uniref:Argininosuccinate lyase n=1 Tax=Escallonia rubra TaxID=112253 RepID=A0AA88QX46_9ASTE|nr:hypothetical protein RJ640_023515 [Escallonia rubra]
MESVVASISSSSSSPIGPLIPVTRHSSTAPRTQIPSLSLPQTNRMSGPPSISCAAQHMSSAQTAQAPPKEAKLWGGRFEEGVTDAVERFTESISFDKALYKHDILGSRAHASMLAHQGLISDSDRDSIIGGLEQIEKQIEDGEFVWRADREDVHMNIEAALTDLVGEPAKKLHTARSRNDQVSTDFRLWCRDAIDVIVARIKLLQVALVTLAKKNEGLIVPGYTHLQRAQPVLLQHLLLAYVEQLVTIWLPEISGDAITRNSIDAVSDRDFVLEFLSANSITAVHLSRLGEEWVLWASEEFGFLTPSDSVSTGSSIMPQKKNPDPMELVRGKSARVIGDLVSLLVLCKGLPHAYNRDLQEDKEPVFDSVKAIIGMLEVSAEFAQNVTFNEDRIRKALPAGHLDATTLADYLGVPFRTSHDIAGRSVGLCVSKNCQLQDLSLSELRSINSVFDEDVYEYLGVENSIKKFSSYGSTGSECVASQLGEWITRLID